MVTAIKDVIRHATGLPDEVLHVLVGLALFLLAALVLRKSLRSWWPFLVVVALQGINEISDMAGDLARYGDIQVRGTIMDTVLTLTVPLLVVVILRRTGPRRGGAVDQEVPRDQR